MAVKRKKPADAPTKVLAALPARSWTIAERQVQVARLYALGYSQAEIGEEVGLSGGQVSKDLANIKARWVEMAVVTHAEHRGRSLDRIDWIERECQEQWERSKRDAESTKVTTEKVMRTEEEVNGSIRGGKRQKGNNGVKRGKTESMMVGVKAPNLKLIPVKKVVERMMKGQTGDVRFIQQIAWCIEMRLKIFGVLEEKKGDVNILNLSWEQLESKVRAQGSDPVEERLRLETMRPSTNGSH